MLGGGEGVGLTLASLPYPWKIQGTDYNPRNQLISEITIWMIGATCI